MKSLATATAALAALSVLLLLSACGGNSVRDSTGDSARAAPMGNAAAQVVHVDRKARIATIRAGEELGQEFLITKDRSGDRSGALRSRPRTPGERLLTADILEGRPQVNHTVEVADDATAEKLAENHRRPGE